MQLEKNMNYESTWIDVAKTVAEDSDIDEYGMTSKRLLILKALGQGPIAEKRLPIVAGVKQEELDKFILPWLLEFVEGQPAFVEVTQRGYAITKTGLAELDKRQIMHKSFEALAAA